MKCPHCKTTLKQKKVKVHGIEVPIFKCGKCKMNYHNKKQIDKKIHEVKKQIENWMKKRKIAKI